MGNTTNCVECRKLTNSHPIGSSARVCHSCYLLNPKKYDDMMVVQRRLYAEFLLVLAENVRRQGLLKTQKRIRLSENVTLVDRFDEVKDVLDKKESDGQ